MSSFHSNVTKSVIFLWGKFISITYQHYHLSLMVQNTDLGEEYIESFYFQNDYDPSN